MSQQVTSYDDLTGDVIDPKAANPGRNPKPFVFEGANGNQIRFEINPRVVKTNQQADLTNDSLINLLQRAIAVLQTPPVAPASVAPVVTAGPTPSTAGTPNAPGAPGSAGA